MIRHTGRGLHGPLGIINLVRPRLSLGLDNDRNYRRHGEGDAILHNLNTEPGFCFLMHDVLGGDVCGQRNASFLERLALMNSPN